MMEQPPTIVQKKPHRTLLIILVAVFLVLVLLTILGSLFINKYIGIIVVIATALFGVVYLSIILAKKLRDRKKTRITPEGTILTERPITPFEAMVNAKKMIYEFFGDYVKKETDFNVQNIGKENEAADPIFIVRGETYLDNIDYAYIQNLRFPQHQSLVQSPTEEKLRYLIKKASTKEEKEEIIEDIQERTPEGFIMTKQHIRREVPSQVQKREEEEKKEMRQLI